MNDKPTSKMAVSKEAWRKTDIHRHSAYACGKCGKRFADPEDFYTHLDRDHPFRWRKGQTR